MTNTQISNKYVCSLTSRELNSKMILQHNLASITFPARAYLANNALLWVLVPDNSGSATENQTKFTVARRKVSGQFQMPRVTSYYERLKKQTTI